MTTTNRICECSDPGCPGHRGRGICSKAARMTVRRIDMDDGWTTFRMCAICGADAIDSGVFVAGAR